MKIFLRILIFLFIISSQFCYASITKIFPHNIGDMVYSPKHNKIFALVGAANPLYGNCFLQINPETLIVEKNVFVGSKPLSIKLTTDEDYAWISLSGSGYVKQVNLNSFEVENEIFLAPIHTQDFGVYSTLITDCFTPLPNSNNKLAVRLIIPFLDGDCQGVVIYEDGKLASKKIGYNNSFVWIPRGFVPISDGKMFFGSDEWSFPYNSPTQFSILNIDQDGIEYSHIFKEELYGGCIKSHNDTIYYSYGSVIDASDISNLKILGNIKHDMISSDYGFTYSESHKAYIYPSLKNNLLYLTFYNKDTYDPIDSVYVDLPLEYRTSIKYVRNIEVIDKDKFCLRISDNESYSKLVFTNIKPSDDATLRSLEVASFQRLLPDFSPDIFEYEVVSPWYIVSNPEPISITNHGKASLKLSHHTIVPSLSTISVTAEDGVTTKEYTLLYKLFTESDTYIPLGVEDLEDNNIVVYPNPVTDIVYLTGLSQNSTLFVYNIKGETKEVKYIDDVSVKIKMSHYASGTYILKIIGSNNEIITKK